MTDFCVSVTDRSGEEHRTIIRADDFVSAARPLAKQHKRALSALHHTTETLPGMRSDFHHWYTTSAINTGGRPVVSVWEV